MYFMVRSRAHGHFLHFHEFCMEQLQGNHANGIQTWRMARQTTLPEHSSMDPSERSLRTETTPQIDYAVSQTAKIHREKPRESRSSAWLFIVKCLFGAFLFVFVLVCLIASKLSLLSIASYYQGNHSKSSFERETLFIMIVLLLMIPEVYTLLTASWTSLFSKTHKWPCRKAVFLGLFSSLLEVFGLCFFGIVVLLDQSIHPGLRIVMMNGVFFVPVLWQVFRSRGCQAQGSWGQCFIFILALILEFAGIGMLTFKMSRESSNTPFWGVPLALIAVSFAWNPEIFKIVTEPVQNHPNSGLDGLSTSQPSTNVENGGLSLPQGETVLGMVTRSKSARGKAAIISSLWKLFLIPFVAALYYSIFKRADLKGLQEGFDNFSVDSKEFVPFMVQIWTSFLGYMLGILACAMCMQLLAFAVPMILATPISVGLTLISNGWAKDHIFHFEPGDPKDVLLYVITGCFLLAQFFSVGYYVLKGQDITMAKESSLFWMPTYNGVFLEQHLLLNRRNEITDDYHVDLAELVKNSCVYICTTMYHENEQEMEQLLNSLHDIDCAREKSRRQIESHIFFDGAIKGDVLNNYVLQLISLIPKALKVSIEVCMKLKTPYGMQMRWRLPGGMFFHIHLKDNLRVKNKKRWSQVMYMSYVLDFKEKLMEVTDENTYILTTDADVRFTHESVEALLDLMVRDPNVGAVCGRTHPLGVGPIVWYQIFDYAIGHWFQKVANHVLGSVLCSPGCFSVYRAAAIRDVLPIYSSKVDTSFDFLTKDMGEDRWLCTLMVQSGWRLDYCAAAEDSTFCPDNFDEFFKQRRRWIPSTLANLALVISQWKLTISNNYISIAFILYQALMVFSTIISPSTVILIMASGMVYAQFPIFGETVILVLLILTSVGYALICLYTSQDFQLKVAFLLTMVLALLMAFVTVGVTAQVADDLYNRSHPTTSPPTTSPVTQPVRSIVQSTKLTAVGLSHSPLPTDTWQHLPTPKPWLAETITNATTASSPTENPGPKLPANVSSLYLGGLIGIFVLAALLHLTEAYCLIHGLWYLFCLPSGYLLLIIYSICNLTDRSWGTREEKIKKVDDVPWYEKLWAKIRSICICCGPQPAPQPAVTDRVDGPPTDSEPPTSPEETDSDAAPPVQENADSGSDGASASSLGSGKLVDEPPPKSAMKQPLVRRPSAPRDGLKEDSGRLGKWRYPGDKKVTFASKLPRLHPETLVEDWLQREFQIYANNFRDGGYDSVSFIVGMTDKHLKAIGIEKRGHRKKLLMEIEKLPQIDIPQEVPENVEDWLNELGLDEYWTNFTQSGYTEPRMLEDLKIMNKETLKETFGITKPGHLDKLYKAIQKVQYPTEAQRRIRHTREETNKLQVMDLKVDNQDGGYEYQFWEGLRQLCLLPESAVFGAVEELKERLEDLRNYTLMVFLIANGMWIILILALMRQSHLQVLGTNVLGLAFLCVYGLIIVIQFLTLLWHRVETFFHVIARAPWRRGQMHMSWAFDDENLPPPPTEADLARVRKKARRPRRPRTRRYSNQPSVSTDERGSLLSDGRPSSSYGSRERDIPHLV